MNAFGRVEQKKTFKKGERKEAQDGKKKGRMTQAEKGIISQEKRCARVVRVGW